VVLLLTTLLPALAPLAAIFSGSIRRRLNIKLIGQTFFFQKTRIGAPAFLGSASIQTFGARRSLQLLLPDHPAQRFAL
jgi:hypothetical protein